MRRQGAWVRERELWFTVTGVHSSIARSQWIDARSAHQARLILRMSRPRLVITAPPLGIGVRRVL